MCSLSGELLSCQRLNGNKRVGGGKGETSRAGKKRSSKGRRKARKEEYGCPRLPISPCHITSAPCRTPSIAKPFLRLACFSVPEQDLTLVWLDPPCPSSPSTAVTTLLASEGFAKRGLNCCLVDGNHSNVPAAADLPRTTREPSLGYLYRCALGCSRPSLARPCWSLLYATPNAAELPSSANDAGHSLRVCPGCFAALG